MCVCVCESVFPNADARASLLLQFTNFCLIWTNRDELVGRLSCSGMMLHCDMLSDATCNYLVTVVWLLFCLESAVNCMNQVAI